jgi:hypothetical protein
MRAAMTVVTTAAAQAAAAAARRPVELRAPAVRARAAPRVLAAARALAARPRAPAALRVLAAAQALVAVLVLAAAQALAAVLVLVAALVRTARTQAAEFLRTSALKDCFSRAGALRKPGWWSGNRNRGNAIEAAFLATVIASGLAIEFERSFSVVSSALFELS